MSSLAQPYHLAWQRPWQTSTRRLREVMLPMTRTVSRSSEHEPGCRLNSHGTVTGFSHMHDSGTGGVSKSPVIMWTLANNCDRALPSATFPFSRRLAALVMSSTDVNSPNSCALLNGSMAAPRQGLDTLPSHSTPPFVLR